MSGFESALADSTATSAAAAATAVTPTPSRATPPSPSITPNNQQASSPPDQSQKSAQQRRSVRGASGGSERSLLHSVSRVVRDTSPPQVRINTRTQLVVRMQLLCARRAKCMRPGFIDCEVIVLPFLFVCDLSHCLCVKVKVSCWVHCV